MPAVLVADLPPPPPGLSGWPWTEGSAPLPESMPGGRPWPRVTVVTPSYNQGEFLERTIRSVLLQAYPRLEYIVIDGGSNDGSREIIEKYARHLAYRVSEPDRGYVHAINKGFRRATATYSAGSTATTSTCPGHCARWRRTCPPRKGRPPSPATS